MKNFYFFVILAWMLFAPASAQTLNPGDIVVIGFAADTGTATLSVDEFSWIPLVNLPEGTKFYFTDAGYNTLDANFMGTAQTEEILLRYIVPPGGIAAGTIFTLTQDAALPANYTYIGGSKFGNDLDHTLSLPNAGDQITVFQSEDDENNPATFGNSSFNALFMVSGSTTVFESLTVSMAAIVPVSDIDNLSNLAPGLTNAVNAVAVGTGPLQADETDNARYVGITSGTREEILFAVSQSSNWSRHDAAFGNDLEFGTTPNGWTANGVSQFAIAPLRVKDFEIENRVSFFPNPSGGKITIRNASGKAIQNLTLYNVSGQTVKSIQNPGENLDLSDLPAGIYGMKFEIETKIMTRKLVRF